MKKHLLTVLALTIFGVAGAQTTHFSQSCGTASGSSGMGSIRLPSGSFVTVYPNGSSSQLVLARYTSAGALQSTHGLSSPSVSFTSVASVAPAAANHILVTGQGDASGYQVFYVADVNLTTNSIKVITSPIQYFSYTKGPKAYYSPEGSIYALFPEYSKYDMHKFDNNLNPLWNKSFECDTVSGKNPGMDCEVVDSSIIIIGKCDSIPGWCDVDTSGSLDTFKLFMINGYTRIYNITQLADGNLLLAGLHSPIYASGTDSRPLLVKVTRGGDVIWARKLDAANPSPVFYRFVDAQAMPDGKIVAFATQTEAYSDTYFDGAVIFDANGNLISSTKFGNYTMMGGSGILYQLYDAKIYNDGILMTGNTVDYGTGATQARMIFSDFNFGQVCEQTNVTLTSAAFTMGTTNNYGTASIRESIGTTPLVTTGNATVTLTLPSPVVCSMSTTGVNEEEEQVNTSVYPNPVMAGDAFAVKLENPGMYTFVITDLSGKLVRTESTIGNRATISTQGLATGAYVLNVMHNNRSVAVHKLMVR